MSFFIEFSDEAKKDILFFQKAGDKSILIKIKSLILNIQEHPFSGIGKPEPLKHQFTGLWSRRINREHRMIYKVNQQLITILSLKGHY
ncbi:MAG: Txe/YoeB family addiction module toxin [Crocinitomicaceae bacterium]|jgi:toxin YoeB